MPGKIIKPFSLVLLPGIDGTGLLSRALISALPPEINPIIVRFPGDKKMSYPKLRSFVLAALPEDKPFILLGESFSGPLAVMIAAEHPQNLIGLILGATFVSPPWRWIGPWVPLITRLTPFGLYLPYKRLKATIFGLRSAEYTTLLSEMKRLLRPAVVANRLCMVFKVDVTHELRACDVPILYLQGAKDPVVPVRNLRIIQQIKPDMRVAVVGDSHLVLQEDPARAVQAICDFAASL